MRIRMMKRLLFITMFAVLALSCSGSSSQLLHNHAEESRVGKPITNVLVLVVLENQEIREIFENHFKGWFAAKGVEAITSIEVLPIAENTKLEKETIVDVLHKYENDAILITNVMEFSETEVFSRDRPQLHYNYYGYYNYAWGYVYWPTIYGEKFQITLENRLYDVETESIIWRGQSLLKNPKSTGQAIGQVVEMVMRDLDENGLLPEEKHQKAN